MVKCGGISARAGIARGQTLNLIYEIVANESRKNYRIK